MPMPAKRSDEKVGRPHHSQEAAPKVDSLAAVDVTVPEPDGDWHPYALQMWEGLIQSPQCVYFTQADWAYAYFTMGAVTECISSGYSAMKLSAVESLLRGLMMTEPERRKARIEVKRVSVDTEAEQAKIRKMNDYRKAAYPDSK